MACSSCAERRRNQVRHEVVTADGKVVYTSTNKATADNVAKRYPDATVREVKPAGKK